MRSRVVGAAVHLTPETMGFEVRRNPRQVLLSHQVCRLEQLVLLLLAQLWSGGYSSAYLLGAEWCPCLPRTCVHLDPVLLLGKKVLADVVKLRVSR